MNQLQPRQIGKVVYEAIRAYDGTIGGTDRKSWEATTQMDRDEILTKVDALLRGVPHAPGSIRPSDQMKAMLLASIVGTFVRVYNPPVVYSEPAPAEIPPPPIPVEVFVNPDSVTAEDVAMAKKVNGPVVMPDGSSVNTDGSVTPPQTITEALAQADANIAKENAPNVTA